MSDDLLNELLPILGRTLDQGFNVFDVMHHGTHEKQLSNVFGWLLDAGGSHNLGDTFVNIFITEINNNLHEAQTEFPSDSYVVRQEVNTAPESESPDIADIVLDSKNFRIVVENYHTSDGHGHDYEHYVAFGRQDGRAGAVVMLCRDEERSRLSMGWENAHTLSYGTVIAQLHETVKTDAIYCRENPDVISFIEQMYQKFAMEVRLVGDRQVLEFIQVMTATGEGARFKTVPHEQAAEQFASDIAVQARQRYLEARELLQRIKDALKAFADGPLRNQLNTSFGAVTVRGLQTNYKGNYQWTIVIELEVAADPSVKAVQLKFGPSAWFANESDDEWKHAVNPDDADYAFVFVTRPDTLVIKQSDVTLKEVLDGLDSSDPRLHDAICDLLT